ncbi:MAG: hypothetical protein JNL54_21025 [Kineosporiaceae bacterium]|nr:hypothetical protein [Kineosporiaceae bacterium]
MSRAQEMHAGGELAVDATRAVIGLARDVHLTIARDVERFLPPPIRQVATCHIRVVGFTYDLVESLNVIGLRAGALVLGALPGPAPTRTRVGRAVQPVVNGIWGDAVLAKASELAVLMALRVDHDDVTPDAEGLADAFPKATGHLVLFVHGLVESDESWFTRVGTPEGRTSFGERLEADLGATALYLRYNSGLVIADNGALLDTLLDAVRAAWPVPVERIDLVGHSMGGLVAREAVLAGADRGAAWVDDVGSVTTLGTPHQGAPLAGMAPVGEWLLTTTARSAPFARLLSGRSAGIRDLTRGSGGRRPHTMPGHVAQHSMAGTLTRSALVGWALGDGMVRAASALLPVPDGAGNLDRLPGVGHQALLRHESVYERLRRWLG